MQYFLIENYFKVVNGFVIVDKFKTLEEAIAVADNEHGLSRGLDSIKWEDGFWDGKKLSNSFGEGFNTWRYEIHRHWEDETNAI